MYDHDRAMQWREDMIDELAKEVRDDDTRMVQRTDSVGGVPGSWVAAGVCTAGTVNK
jgi:hypothetical protein